MERARKNILFLTTRVPFPPDKGDKIRTFHQIDHLAANHNVYCACFIDDEGDRSHLQTLRRWCKDVTAVRWKKSTALRRAATAMLRGGPISRAVYEDAEMRRALAKWFETIDFDVAVAFSSGMASYALSAPAGRRILDLCDADSQKWLDYAERAPAILSSIYRSEGNRLRCYELNCLGRFDATLVITPFERAILDPTGSCPRLKVCSNGVDLPAQTTRPASLCGHAICFVGVMSYRPNVEAVEWFVQEVWPDVRRHSPMARFVIVGRAPNRRVRRLGRVEGVELTGAVSAVQPFLESARCVVAPLRIARGLQNKVLEAMAMSRPVIASTAVANCFDCEPGREMIVADHPADFAAKVVQVLRDDALCDRLGEAGRARAAANYDWKNNLNEYERILLGNLDDLTAIDATLVATGSAAPRQSPAHGLVSGYAAVRDNAFRPDHAIAHGSHR